MTINTILDMYIKVNQIANAMDYFEEVNNIGANVSTYTIIIGMPDAFLMFHLILVVVCFQ
jgi:hypothetical protein